MKVKLCLSMLVYCILNVMRLLAREYNPAQVKNSSYKENIGDIVAVAKGVEKLNNVAEELVEASAVIAVYDSCGDVDLATFYGKTARTMFKAYNFKDTLAQYVSLGGVAADYGNLGFDKGTVAAYERLSQHSATKSWVKIGEWLGGVVADVVWKVKKEMDNKKRKGDLTNKSVVQMDGKMHTQGAALKDNSFATLNIRSGKRTQMPNQGVKAINKYIGNKKPNSQCKKKDLLEEKVCLTDSVSVNKFKATDAGDADSENLTGEVGNGDMKVVVAKTDTDDVKDSTDKGMSSESITVEAKDDGGVGVRGWCKCVNNDDDVIAVGFGGKTSKASYTDEEHELMRSRFKASRFHSYVYFICRQCGRCSTKGKIGGSGPLKNLSIFDFTLAEQFEEEKKTKVMSDSDYRRHNAMMIGVNKKLLTIPEGQIVIPGSCLCLKPDLVTVGLAASDKFQVCRYCGWKWVSAKE